MEKLTQIGHIRDKIKTAPRPAIVALHKLLFEEEGDRQNRQRIRDFSGFGFSERSNEFQQKLNYASSLSTGDLISICNILGLDYSGNKDQLRQRIVHSLMDINTLEQAADMSDEDEDQDEGNDEDEERGEEENNQPIDMTTKFSMSYKDVEDSIRSFNGSDDYPIERWIADFQETAELFGWNNIQQLVYAKKSLTGLAKLFIRGETGIKTWTTLKKKLREEFSIKTNTAQLHKLLEERKIKKGESLQEYLLVMKELAARGTLEVESFFHYVIKGLGDTPSNKAVLYGATSMKDL